MTSPTTLSTAPPEHPALDYEFLRQEGIRHLERLAGQLWTDFNTHDPGITILEQVCYALTDLAHRVNYEIPDLLQGDGVQANDSFFTPAEILSTRPVTMKDLRKLLIDIEGIKNAWITVVKQPSGQADFYYNIETKSLSFTGNRLTDEAVSLKGLYQVLLEFEDTLHLEGQERAPASDAALQRLHANRNLGEDITLISQLDAQYVQVLAHVEIDPVDSPEQVLLDIYEQLSEHISPSIQFYSLSEMLERGKRVDEVFDGPLLDHGFIDDDELEHTERRTALRTSDLIQVMMDAAGVKAVRYVKMEADRTDPIRDDDVLSPQPQVWSLNLDTKRAAKFDVTKSAIILERNGLPVTVDYANVERHYKTRLKEALPQTLPAAERDLKPPTGQDRQVGKYFSIQHQFPATYGIGAIGLPNAAPTERHAQAKQLKAYLLFFDQLLANYFSQLQQVKDLFSFQGADVQTYFAQAIDDPSLSLDDIRKEGHAERLQSISNAPETAILATSQRRNRFLNHLLARFAEQFTDYALLLFDANPNTDQGKLIADKQAFLQNYPTLSSTRSTAYNYLQPADTHNRSGLENRIRHKLGLHAPDEDFILVEHILLRPMAGDQTQTGAVLADPSHKDPYSLRLSFIFPDLPEPSNYGKSAFRAFVERTVREESPAHLSVDIQWFTPDKMTVFRTAYQDWLDKRRAYWTEAGFFKENAHEPR